VIKQNPVCKDIPMTLEQINEVKSAVFEMYTDEEIHDFIANGKWTKDMFRFFIKEMVSYHRKDAIRSFRK
jgi:hypothetical protein